MGNPKIEEAKARYAEIKDALQKQKEDAMGTYEDRTLAYTAMKMRTLAEEVEGEDKSDPTR